MAPRSTILNRINNLIRHKNDPASTEKEKQNAEKIIERLMTKFGVSPEEIEELVKERRVDIFGIKIESWVEFELIYKILFELDIQLIHMPNKIKKLNLKFEVRFKTSSEEFVKIKKIYIFHKERIENFCIGIAEGYVEGINLRHMRPPPPVKTEQTLVEEYAAEKAMEEAYKKMEEESPKVELEPTELERSDIILDDCVTAARFIKTYMMSKQGYYKYDPNKLELVDKSN